MLSVFILLLACLSFSCAGAVLESELPTGSADLKDYCSIDSHSNGGSVICNAPDVGELNLLFGTSKSAWVELFDPWDDIEVITFQLGAGRYILGESIDLHKSLRDGLQLKLQGQGSSETTLQCVDSSVAALNVTTAMNVTLQGISIESCNQPISVTLAEPTMLPVLLTVDECRFTGNTGQSLAGVAHVSNITSITISNSHFVDNVCTGDFSSGVLFVSGVGSITIFNSTFTNNSSPGFFSSGVVNAKSCGSFTIQRSTFIANTVKGNMSSGVLFFTGANRSGVVDVEDCAFLNNTMLSSNSPGAVYVAGLARAFFLRSTFISNQGFGDLSRGAMSSYKVDAFLVHQCDFVGNRADCDFDNRRHPTRASFDPYAPKASIYVCGGGGITLIETLAFISNSTFTSNAAQTSYGAGGAILIMMCPDAYVSNSSFVDNRATMGGAVSLWANAHLMLDLPFFNPIRPCTGDLSITIVRQAFPILFDLHTDIPEPSTFYRNIGAIGGGVSVGDSSLAVGFFPHFKCTGYPDWRNGAYRDTVFHENRAYVGGAISIIRAFSVYIVYTRFADNVAMYPTSAGVPTALAKVACGAGNGGAICLSMTGLPRGLSLAIAASNFQNNTAVYGGGLYVTADEVTCTRYEECNLLYLTGLMACDANYVAFYTPGMGNTLFPTSQVKVVNNTAYGGAGGGLYAEHTKLVKIQCGSYEYPDISLIGSPPFPYNVEQLTVLSLKTACIENPDRMAPGIEVCPWWKGNKAVAGGFGAEVAGTPHTFTVELVQPWQVDNYTSGDPMPLLIKGFDMFGNESITAFRNQVDACDVLYSIAALTPEGGVISTFNIKAVPGRLPVSATTIWFESSPGPVVLKVEAFINKIIRKLEPGRLNRGQRLSASDPTSLYTDVTVRNCRVGEYTRGRRCLKCDAGRYNLVPSAETCEVCPGNAVCITNSSRGGFDAIIAPEDGFYNSNPFSDQVLQCRNYFACMYTEARLEAITKYQNQLIQDDPYSPWTLARYNPEEYYTVVCAEGYGGPLCAICQPGYGSTSQVKCVKCHYSQTLNIILVIVLHLAFLIPLVWSMGIAMSVSKDAPNTRCKVLDDPKKVVRQEAASAMKILVSYFHVLGMMTWVNLSGETSVNEMVRAVEFFADSFIYFSGNMISIPCALGLRGMDGAIAITSVGFLYPLFALSVLIIIFGFPDFWRAIRKWINTRFFRAQESIKTVKSIRAIRATRKSKSMSAYTSQPGMETATPSSIDPLRPVEAGEDGSPKSPRLSVFLGAYDLEDNAAGVDPSFSVHEGLPEAQLPSRPHSITSISYRPSHQVEEAVPTKAGPQHSRLASQNNMSIAEVLLGQQKSYEIRQDDPSQVLNQSLDSNAVSNIVLSQQQVDLIMAAADFRGTNGQSKMKKLKIATIVGIMIASYFYFPAIVQSTIIIFMCYPVDTAVEDPSDLASVYGLYTGVRWFKSYDTTCFEGRHLFLTCFLGIPGLLFSVGFPALWAWWLFKNRMKLNDYNFRSRFLFMMEDFKPEYYNWGAFEAVRKLLLLVVFIVLSDNSSPPGLQVILAIFICFLWLSIYIRHAPHKSPTCFHLEVWSQYTIFLTLLCFLFYTYDDVPESYFIFPLAAGIHNLITTLILVLGVVFLDFKYRLAVAEIETEEVGDIPVKEMTHRMWPHRSDHHVWQLTLRCFYILPVSYMWRALMWARERWANLVRKIVSM